MFLTLDSELKNEIFKIFFTRKITLAIGTK